MKLINHLVLSSITGGNVFGVAFIFALQVLIQEPALGPPPLAPASLLLLGASDMSHVLTWLGFVHFI